MSLEHQLQPGLDLLTAVLSFTLAAPACFFQLSSCPKEKGQVCSLVGKKKKKKGAGGEPEMGSNLPDFAHQISDSTYLLVLEPVLFSELGVCQRCAKVFVRGGGGGPGGVHTFGHEDVGLVGCRCHASYIPSLTYHGWSPGLPQNFRTLTFQFFSY